MTTKKTDYKALRTELDDILEQLQSGDIHIDQAVPAYERGMKLVAELENYLKTAENRIEEIQAKLQAE